MRESESEQLEQDIRYTLARLINRNPRRARRWTQRLNLRRLSQSYLVRPDIPGLVRDDYTARTLKAHQEEVERLQRRLAEGCDLWQDTPPDTEYFDEELTDAERTFILRVLSLSHPIASRKKRLTTTTT